MISRVPILLLALGAGPALAVAMQPQMPVQTQGRELSRGGYVPLPPDRWTTTEFDVLAGDRLTLAPSALPLETSAAQRILGDPAGQPEMPDPGKPLQGAPTGAVIGRIGGGEPFLVGARFDGVAPAAGRLELGINVGPRLASLLGSVPAFGVVVTISTPAPPAPPPPPPEPSPPMPLPRPDPPPPPPADDWTWLILPLAGGLGAALLLAAGVRLLRRKPVPAPPVAFVITPSLDPLEGASGGDEISLSGPEIRLGTTLEPGEIQYPGAEPAIEREERDGGA
jgi:hypothetical protein